MAPENGAAEGNESAPREPLNSPPRARGRGGQRGRADSTRRAARPSQHDDNHNTNNNVSRAEHGGRASRGSAPKGAKGRARGRGGAHASPIDAADQESAKSDPLVVSSKLPDFKHAPGQPDGEDNGDIELCFICANPVIHQSIAPCNHLTCHICSLRMRALYKTKDCPHCRTAAPFVIFSDDASKRFADYTSTDVTTTDDNIGIKYTSEDIVGDTVLLLRYNCPDDSCDFAGLGWPDLHRHVRSVHHKKMCDLCTRNKKVFTHEHELFADKELERHMRHGDDRPGAVDQTGFKGHPLCGFCGERFYDDDRLYEHCRNKHERCFICDRQNSSQPHYYLNYNALEEHFRKDHFPCMAPECQEKKFVVFASEMDLKAHQLSEHGNTLSKDVRRDARVVDISNFDYRPTYQQERSRGGGGGRSREGRGRGRDPNTEPLPPSSAQPMRRDELAFQRQMAIHSAQSISNRTFGGQLTSSTGPPSTQTPGQAAAASQQRQPLVDDMENLTVDPATLPAQERARLMRHSSVIERAEMLLGHDHTKMNTFRSHISSYRSGSVNAPQLIDSFFALFSDTSSNALGTLVREVADLFEDRGKAGALRKAWQDWRAINEDYPSLPGISGMHGASSSSSGWAAAAAGPATTQSGTSAAAQNKHTTRVLKLKNSTRRASGAGMTAAAAAVSGPGAAARSRNPPPALAPSPSAFPALPSLGAGRPSQPSWFGTPVGSSSGVPRMGTPVGASAPAARRSGGPGAGRNSEEAFPALPAAPKPQTTIFGYGTGALRRNVGGGQSTGFSWGGGASGVGGDAADPEGPEGGVDATGGGKKKKGKKQVLVQWG